MHLSGDSLPKLKAQPVAALPPLSPATSLSPRFGCRQVAVRFFLYTEEAGDAVAREGEEEGDIVLVPSGGATDYRSIVFKVGRGFKGGAAGC